MSPQPSTVFYDGHCGLCHGFVLFLLARDPGGTLFEFAPLGGDTFAKTVEGSVRNDLPDSVVIRTRAGVLLVKSAAVLFALGEIGGIYRIPAAIGRLLPGSFLDLAYDGVARIRRRLFRAPPDTCPLLVAPELRSRFRP